jgi:hypothetical protein
MIYLRYNPMTKEVILPAYSSKKFIKESDSIIEISDEKWAKICNKKLTVVNGKVKAEEKPATIEDYDKAMEEHLKAERVARGYTLREPSDYKDDPNPRFAQDAQDWIAYRSAIMTYGLEVQNHYAETGEAPTLAEFKAALVHITWTYQD